MAAVSWLVANLLRFAWRFRADIWQPDWVHQTTGDRNGHAFLSNPEGYSAWLGPRRAAISFPMPNSRLASRTTRNPCGSATSGSARSIRPTSGNA